VGLSSGCGGQDGDFRGGRGGVAKVWVAAAAVALLLMPPPPLLLLLLLLLHVSPRIATAGPPPPPPSKLRAHDALDVLGGFVSGMIHRGVVSGTIDAMRIRLFSLRDE
jgi:hypothetical protein